MTDVSAPYVQPSWVEQVYQQAYENVQTWGDQSVEELLLAMQEELGELTQAHLEYHWEDGDDYDVPEELIDLAALQVQLQWRISGAAVLDTDGGGAGD